MSCATGRKKQWVEVLGWEFGGLVYQRLRKARCCEGAVPVCVVGGGVLIFSDDIDLQ